MTTTDNQPPSLGAQFLAVEGMSDAALIATAQQDGPNCVVARDVLRGRMTSGWSPPSKFDLVRAGVRVDL